MSTTSFRRMLFKTPMRDLVRGRITGRLDLDQLLEASSLSGSAADKVRHVVKRTRLWRLEKVDVANELIAHFQDGQEAETPTEKMIENFGDERQTAKLIRRAKKRQRPMIWHVFAWARLGLAGLFACYLMTFVYFMMGSPDVKVDYLTQFNARANAVPEEERAWPLYRQAMIVMDLRREREWDTPIPYYTELPKEKQDDNLDELEPPYRHSLDARIKKSLHPDDPGWSATADFLREHADELALIRDAAKRQGMGLASGFPEDYTSEDRAFFKMRIIPGDEAKAFTHPDKNLISVLLPHLGQFRQMARLLSADAHLASIEDDADRVYANLIAIGGLAEHSREAPCLISELVSVSLHSMAYELLSELMVHDPSLMSDNQLQELAHQYAAADLSYEAGIRGEWQWFEDQVQRIYTDDGHGDGRITPEGLKLLNSFMSNGDPFKSYIRNDARNLLGPATLVTMASRKELTDEHRRLMQMQADQYRKPLWERDRNDPIENELVNWTLTDQSRYALISVMMPAMGAAYQTFDIVRSQREGALVGIALELYRRERDQWPGALEALVPGYLPSIPIDRLTGKPLQYVLVKDSPVVYSLGVDGDDDGGRPPSNAKTGEVDNSMASPRKYGREDVSHPELDGDWVLWPDPDP